MTPELLFIRDERLEDFLKRGGHLRFTYWQDEDYLFMESTKRSSFSNSPMTTMIEYELGYFVFHWLKSQGYGAQIKYVVITEHARRDE